MVKCLEADQARAAAPAPVALVARVARVAPAAPAALMVAPVAPVVASAALMAAAIPVALMVVEDACNAIAEGWKSSQGRAPKDYCDDGYKMPLHRETLLPWASPVAYKETAVPRLRVSSRRTRNFRP